MISLVENDDFHAGESYRAAPNQVEQAPGAGHDHVWLGAQRAHLWVDRDPTKDSHRLHAGVLAKGYKLAMDLICQFTRRRNHQDAREDTRSTAFQEAVKDRQDECRGLTGSRLG